MNTQPENQQIDSAIMALARRADVTLTLGGEPGNYHSEGAVTVGQVRKLKSGGYCLVVKRDGRRPAWMGGPSRYHYFAVPCGPPLAARQAARRREIERLVQRSPQEQDARMQTWDRGEMVKCWGDSRMGGHEGLWADTTGRLVYETSHYDDGPSAWLLTDATLAAESIALRVA